MSSGLIILLVILVTILIGAGLAWYARRQRARAEVAKQWPTADGTIVSSYVGTRSTDADGVSVTHVAVVNFSYQVSGASYQSNRLTFGGNVEGSQAKMTELVGEYPAGKIVPVRYDPKNPATAVLRPDITSAANTMFWVGLLIVAIGVALAAMQAWRFVKYGSL